MTFAKVSNCGSVTVAVLLVIVRTALSLSANQGFSYGLEVGDSLVNASDDGHSDEVVTFTPYIFYGSSETSLFVSRCNACTQ